MNVPDVRRAGLSLRDAAAKFFPDLAKEFKAADDAKHTAWAQFLEKDGEYAKQYLRRYMSDCQTFGEGFSAPGPYGAYFKAAARRAEAEQKIREALLDGLRSGSLVGGGYEDRIRADGWLEIRAEGWWGASLVLSQDQAVLVARANGVPTEHLRLYGVQVAQATPTIDSIIAAFEPKRRATKAGVFELVKLLAPHIDHAKWEPADLALRMRDHWRKHGVDHAAATFIRYIEDAMKGAKSPGRPC